MISDYLKCSDHKGHIVIDDDIEQTYYRKYKYKQAYEKLAKIVDSKYDRNGNNQDYPTD